MKYVLLIVALAIALIPTAAQSQPDGERTLEDLLRRLNAVATDPDNYTRDIGGFSILVTTPTTSGDHIFRIKGDPADDYVSYRISHLDSSSFCVIPNLPPEAIVPLGEECFDFAQIGRILFGESTEHDLHEMPSIGEQVYPQTSNISGLAAQFDQLNEPTNTSPNAYTGYFLQFRHSIFGDNPDGLGVFVGVHYRGTDGGGINRVDAISYQQDYLCFQVLRSSVPEAGTYQYYCVPHSNIASVRLLRNADVGQDILTIRNADNVDIDVAALDVSEFLAAQQGAQAPIAEEESGQMGAVNTSDTDILTWWASGQTPLVLTLKVPIDENGTPLTVARDQTSEDVDYWVTEVGEGYLCFATTDQTITLGELCTTFDNIARADLLAVAGALR